TREVAYRSLLPATRRDLHRKIVAIMEAMPFEGPEHIDRLGRHALHAELWTEAAGYLKQAGDRAIGGAAHLPDGLPVRLLRQAAEYFTQALGALGHLPETPEGLAEVVDVRLRLRCALSPQLQLPAPSRPPPPADAIAPH